MQKTTLEQILKLLADYDGDCVIETVARTPGQVPTVSWGDNQQYGLFLYDPPEEVETLKAKIAEAAQILDDITRDRGARISTVRQVRSALAILTASPTAV